MQLLNSSQARQQLSRDPVLKSLISRFGIINYPPPRDRFNNLASTIIGQQLSNKAADTIYGRFVALLPNKKVTPQNILNTSDTVIRSAGASWAKIRSLKDLSQKILDKTVDLDSLDSLTDSEVVDHLTQVKGIGRWTAEMKLMFVLHRPDVFPVDDRGIQNAMIKLYDLKDNKSLQANMQKLSRSWQPFRTVACWYLWKSLDNQV